MSFPFFIVGSVRSGTTLLRDELRKNPGLICPEETHFYRWGDPFGSPAMRKVFLNGVILKKHREMDGVSEKEFLRILESSNNRAELVEAYMAAHAKAKGLQTYRWFDKTPQNIYGLALLSHQMPHAKFLNPVRNPLNVIASLRVGKVVHVPNIRAACNFWVEAQMIVISQKESLQDRLLTFKYEDLVSKPFSIMTKMCTFLELPLPENEKSFSHFKAERNQWKSLFKRDELELIKDLCGPVASQFGYDLEADMANA